VSIDNQLKVMKAGDVRDGYMTSVLMDNFRKKAVLISCVPAYIGAVLCFVCQLAASPELLMVGRFVTGINCGM